jgi:CRP-like cAMP-binding protein
MDLLQYFRLFYPVSEAPYNLLVSRFKSKSFQKGEVILQPGEIQQALYFVKEGIQMSFVETANKPHVIAFTYPPNLCAIPESFMLQRPAPYCLKCLTDSEMHYLSFNTLNQLFDESQPLERLFRKMTEAVLVGIITRHVELHTLTIEERFKVFAQRSPQLLQHIPHKYLASYLGIDPTNFSKLYNSVRID